MTLAAKESEPGTRSDSSEAPAKPKKKPRKKTNVWRLNNQLAQKRFRQKQKVCMLKRSCQTAHVAHTCKEGNEFCLAAAACLLVMQHQCHHAPGSEMAVHSRHQCILLSLGLLKILRMQEKQQAQQERVVELSERVADLQQKHRSLRSMLEAYQQVHSFSIGPHDKLFISSSDTVMAKKLCPHPQ